MLNRLPTQPPALSAMLDDIGNPSTKALARSLDVTERTVRRWLADDEAPRPVLLALFWITRWGQSSVDADAHNAAVLYAAQARAALDDIERLRAELARVLALSDSGAANVPSLAALPLAQVLSFRRPG